MKPLCIALVLTGIVINMPGLASDYTSPLSDSVSINANPTTVWAAIKHYKKASLNRKVLKRENNASLVEETFDSLPIIGAAKCVYRETEKPLERIDYELVKSDKLTVFEGSWVITPQKDGKSSILKLTSKTETNVHVPFGRRITQHATSKELKCRLLAVKKLAEND